MDDQKSLASSQSKLKYGCKLCTDFKPSSRNFNAERHIWVQHVRDGHHNHDRSPYEPFLFKQYVKDHVIIVKSNPEAEASAGEDAQRTTHLRWVDMTDAVTQSGPSLSRGLSIKSGGNSLPEDGAEARRGHWHPYSRSPIMPGSGPYSRASPRHSVSSQDRALSRSYDGPLGSSFPINHAAREQFSDTLGVRDMYNRRPNMREDYGRPSVLYHGPSYSRYGELQRQMPTRDQRNQSTRPLQRDMAIDPDRRRSSEPLRYLQRPMAPPPHHFTREGYTGEYSRAGRYQQTESPMQQYSDHPWRYGHAGSTSLDADLDRARRWDMAYAAPRGTAQQHRGLQRDMPWSSRDRIHHVEPGLHPSQRQYTGAGDHVRLPGTTRSLEEPIYRPDKYEPRMESPYGKRRDSATSFFSEVFTEVGYDRGHSPTAINDSSSSDTRPDTGGQP